MSFATLALNRCYLAGSSSAKPSTLKTLECTIFFDGKPKSGTMLFLGLENTPKGKSILVLGGTPKKGPNSKVTSL